ncbi:ESPR-type extended signal peptide-containing protein, partial [uncultured Parasutterella sp.]
MNRIFRVIFNRSRGLFTVVNENTLSNSKEGRQSLVNTPPSRLASCFAILSLIPRKLPHLLKPAVLATILALSSNAALALEDDFDLNGANMPGELEPGVWGTDLPYEEIFGGGLYDHTEEWKNLFSSILKGGNVLGGNGNQAQGANNILFGLLSQAVGQGNIVTGEGSTAFGKDNIAIGHNAGYMMQDSGFTAEANLFAPIQDSIAMGTEARAYVNKGLAIGASALVGNAIYEEDTGAQRLKQTTPEGSVAIGAYSRASLSRTDVAKVGFLATKTADEDTLKIWHASSEFAIGYVTSDGSVSRRITGVAAGLNDDDAVNVAQLREAYITLVDKDNSKPWTKNLVQGTKVQAGSNVKTVSLNKDLVLADTTGAGSIKIGTGTSDLILTNSSMAFGTTGTTIANNSIKLGTATGDLALTKVALTVGGTTVKDNSIKLGTAATDLALTKTTLTVGSSKLESAGLTVGNTTVKDNSIKLGTVATDLALT